MATAIIAAYIFLYLNIDMIITASPVPNPMIDDRAIATSVPIVTDCGYCDHVWQLATQMSNPVERKKFS